MKIKQQSLQALITELPIDSTVITVNQRLSTLIRKTYNEQKQNLGLKVWPSLDVLPLNAWISRLWHSLKMPLQLLHPLQEQAIWQQIIHSSLTNLPFLNIEQTVSLIRQAWQQLHHWQLTPDDLQPFCNQQIEYFIQWSASFQNHNQLNACFTLAELPNLLIDYIEKHHLHINLVPRHLLIVGFDELSPSLEKLFHSLNAHSTMSRISLQETQGEPIRVIADNRSEEIALFISWAKKTLTTHPDYSIACIIPDLATCRPFIVNELQNAFQTEHHAPFESMQLQAPFNISAGQRLIEFEVIHIALEILSLLTGQFQIDRFGSILQSPYLKHHEFDHDFGALLDFEMRESAFPEMALEELFSFLNRLNDILPQQTWRKRLHLFYNGFKKQSLHQLPSQWGYYFAEQLELIGWPGCRKRNSLEFQLMQKWQQLLKELAFLDEIYPEMNVHEAIAWVHTLAQQTLFQAKGNPAARIQILGLLESVGYYFDAMWVMGLHDEAWPPPLNPNPFLPYQLQQRLHMPHASSDRELKYTIKTTQRLLHSAKKIIFSTPASEGEKIFKPSQLIELFPIVDLPDLITSEASIDFPDTPALLKFQIIEDRFAPPIQSTDIIRGGSSILTEQATCPFRAFALIRLEAKTLPETYFALSAKHRGILLHQTLAAIWLTLNNQSTLLNTPDDVLKKIINEHLEHAIHSVFPIKQRQLLRPLLQVEQKCIAKLIEQWLMLEKQRPLFKVIACEYQQTVTIGTLDLTIQIDRIDELEHHKKMIIDYKTGSQLTIQSWLGPRPQQPQLPLYCLSESTGYAYSCITFAQIRIDNMQFKGICAEEQSNPVGHLKGIIAVNQLKLDAASTWPTLQTHWQTSLTALAQDFTAGDAKIDPINGLQTCQQCHLNSLCRYTLSSDDLEVNTTWT